MSVKIWRELTDNVYCECHNLASLTEWYEATIEFFVVNPILSHLTILCRFVFRKYQLKILVHNFTISFKLTYGFQSHRRIYTKLRQIWQNRVQDEKLECYEWDIFKNIM